jgi:RNA polymerase sigma-70 factor (ECF subfamily)
LPEKASEEEEAMSVDPVEKERQIQVWLEAARQGSLSSLGELLDTCRNYLLLVANQSMDGPMQAKVAPSDIVQETFLRAQHHFQDFQGQTEEEFLTWLKRILINQLHDTRRHFEAQKRDLGRESEQSPSQLAHSDETPSGQVATRETNAALEAAMARLPEDYRQVVVLRNWERKSFEEIGTIMGRSPDASRKLWARAVETLQELLSQL